MQKVSLNKKRNKSFKVNKIVTSLLDQNLSKINVLDILKFMRNQGNFNFEKLLRKAVYSEILYGEANIDLELTSSKSLINYSK